MHNSLYGVMFEYLIIKKGKFFQSLYHLGHKFSLIEFEMFTMSVHKCLISLIKLGALSEIAPIVFVFLPW